jgi:flavin-dependent dehydrogenase
MPDTDPTSKGGGSAADYDAVVVGASLAGCATAIQLGRAGASVALIDKSPNPRAFKRTCSHFIQASAVPTLERLEILDPIMAAGGLRSRARAWSPWGWIEAPHDRAGYGVNLRRELLDPLIRETAAATPGVELMLGRGAHALVREGNAFRGVVARDRDGEETTLRGRLVVGADGRDTRVAELAGARTKTLPHGRFAYGAYFEGPPPGPDNVSTLWMLDPQWVAAFPTDSDLVFYAAMPTKDRLPEFKRDPLAAMISFVADAPDAPPILDSRAVTPAVGKIEMPNRVRDQVAPGLALVGDAALAVDPLFGVGCGWALQSSEWLAESVVPALRGEEELQKGLERYRRRHVRELRGHAWQVNEYATGRRQRWGELAFARAAARDPGLATAFDAFGTRQIKPGRMFALNMPRAIAVNARYALTHRRSGGGGARRPAEAVG